MSAYEKRRLNELISKCNKFILLSEKNIKTQPWLVVVLMHEYYRNLYPIDPHIPFSSTASPLKRVERVLDQNIKIMTEAPSLGSYFKLNPKTMKQLVAKGRSLQREREGQTQKVYGALWDQFDAHAYAEESKQILKERLKRSGFNFKSLKNKVVLDLGCGSGRFSIALALLTEAKKVYGVDLGRESCKRGERIAKKLRVTNIHLKMADALKVPFRNNFFDFVFCNGVLHHTINMEKGIRELYRVLKKGGRSFLYLYANGGLFWYSWTKVPQLMKKIPQEYSMMVLELLGMPGNRFIFCDNWYVPRERHTGRHYLENYLKKTGFSEIKKIVGNRKTDLDRAVSDYGSEGRILWGEGEHRYLLRK